MPNLNKSIRILLALTFAAALVAHAQSDAQKAFSAIKNMPGTWEGKGDDGQPATVGYDLALGNVL